MPVVLGMPVGELIEQAERGEVALGGCVVSADDPQWTCRCPAAWRYDGTRPVRRAVLQVPVASVAAARLEELAPDLDEAVINGAAWYPYESPDGETFLLPEDLWDELEVLGEWSDVTEPSGAPVTWELGETIGRIGNLYVYWNRTDGSEAVVPVGRYDDERAGVAAAAFQADHLRAIDGRIISTWEGLPHE